MAGTTQYSTQIMQAADLTPFASIVEFGLQIGQACLGLSKIEHATDEVEAVPF